MADTPKPFVALDTDLRSFDYMPLKVAQLRDSDLVAKATGEEFRAAVILWGAAWHQVPASSLPNDDQLLAHLVGMGRDIRRWKKIRDMALRGFVLCSDGRLYHPLIADLATTAFEKKKKNDDRTKNANEARRRKQDERNNERDEQCNDDRNNERDVARKPNVTSSKGEGTELNETEQKEDTPSSPPPAEEALRLWNALAAEHDLPIAQRLTEPRRRSILVRLTECGGIEGWVAALSKVAQSTFLRGYNDRGFRADIDFMLQQKSFTSLMEGKYDDRKPRTANGKGHRHNPVEEGFAFTRSLVERREAAAHDDDLD